MRGALLTLFVLLGFPAFLSAQSVLPKIVPPASVTATPSSPEPGEKVTIEASTPIFNRDTTFYEWTVNGQFRADLSGQGKYAFDMTAGKTIGSTITAFVRATASDGKTTTAQRVIPVSSLSLVWFAETTVPLWYMGKALPSPRAFVSVTALPEIAAGGKMADPKKLLYKWSVGDTKSYASGVGKQSIRFQTSQIPKSSHWIRVTIEDTAKTVKKEGAIFVINREPMLAVYRYSPTGGTEYRRAESLLEAPRGGTLNLIAEPFFFPGSTKDISFAWSVGGIELEKNVNNPNIVTIETGQVPSASLLISILASSLKQTALAPVAKTLTLFIR